MEITQHQQQQAHTVIRSEFNFEMNVVLTQPKPSLHILTHDRHDVYPKLSSSTLLLRCVRRCMAANSNFALTKAKKRTRKILHSFKSHDFSVRRQNIAAQTNRFTI